ncbi:MAG: L-lactate dehydrogenase [Clostridia bacterium]|nr:L-lactate dehydrogenase [Clostridia bacterium]
MFSLPLKIAVIGAGAVGSSVVYTLMTSGFASELVLIDVDRDRAEGEALDIADGTPFAGPVRIYAGDYSHCSDAGIVIFAAGANQRPGESRLDLCVRNLKVVRSVVDNLAAHWKGGVLIMVSNPVDILTYAALKYSGLPPEKIIGSGTVLDSARFRHLLSRHCQVDTRNVHAYVVGEHGDSEVFLWSRSTIAGVELDEFCDRRGVPRPDRKWFADRVRGAAAAIIARKGATHYGVSLSVRRICEAIVMDQQSILTVSGLVNGEYGITDNAFSLPCVVGREGRSDVLDIPLPPNEEGALHHSADVLKAVLRSSGLA